MKAKEFDELCKDAGLSIKELCTLLGRNRVTLWRYRNRDEAAPKMAVRLLEFEITKQNACTE